MKRMNLRLDFETCDDKKGDTYIKWHLEEICGEILTSLDSGTVKSIILTGGITRKEGSAIRYGERIEVFSDYDFLVLADKVTYKIRKQLRNISTKLTKEFSREGLPSHVDIAPISIHALSNMKARMFTLELKEYGRSLYGEDHREYMPDVKAEDIKQEDSLRMLHNRIVGVLEYFDPAIFLWKERKDESLAKFLLYHIAKNLIDLGSSLLSFEKMYVCSYRERVEVLKDNFEKFNISEEYLPLPEIVEEWTEFKLNPDIEGLLKERGYGNPDYEDIIEFGKELWFEHVGYVEALWKYEVQKRYNTEGTDISKLIDVYFESNNTLREKLAGCYRYVVKKPADFPFHSLVNGCLKSIKGSALVPSVYSLSNLIFFYAPIILKQNTFPQESSFKKYVKRLPINPSRKWDTIGVWDSARINAVHLWHMFVC
jgi:hypothetical protein